jgi:hypothetical protein
MSMETHVLEFSILSLRSSLLFGAFLGGLFTIFSPETVEPFQFSPAEPVD